MDLIIVKLALVVIGAVGVGLWQLYDVNRELKKHADEEKSNEADEA